MKGIVTEFEEAAKNTSLQHRERHLKGSTPLLVLRSIMFDSDESRYFL